MLQYARNQEHSRSFFSSPLVVGLDVTPGTWDGRTQEGCQRHPGMRQRLHETQIR